MFQFPLITRSLIRSGIVSYRSVTGKRPHVIVGILLLAALLTPPDIVSQLMLAVPTYALFETSLFFFFFFTKIKKVLDLEHTLKIKL